VRPRAAARSPTRAHATRQSCVKNLQASALVHVLSPPPLSDVEPSTGAGVWPAPLNAAHGVTAAGNRDARRDELRGLQTGLYVAR